MPVRRYPALLAAAALAAAPRAAAPPRGLEVAVREIRPGVDPAHLVARAGTLYTSGFHAGRVTAIDLPTGRRLGETTLDGYERVTTEVIGGETVRTRVVGHRAGGSLALAGGRLFVSQGGGGPLLVIDPRTMRVVRRLPLGDGLLAATPDGATVVCARTGRDEFHLIDAETYRHTTVSYPAGGTGVGAVAVSPDGRSVVLGIQRGGQPPGGRAAIAGGNTFLAVYDLAAKRYAATVYLASSDRESVSEFVFALAFAPDGGALYAGMFQAATGVRVVDPKGWRVVGDVRLAPDARRTALPYTNPLGLAFSGGWPFVANRENGEVLVIDPASRSPAARLRFAGGRHAFHRVLVEGDRVYLADQDAVYELDGPGLTRRLTAWAAGQAPLEVVLAVRRE